MTASFAAISQLVDALGHVPVVVGVLTKGSLLIVLAVGLRMALGLGWRPGEIYSMQLL